MSNELKQRARRIIEAAGDFPVYEELERVILAEFAAFLGQPAPKRDAQREAIEEALLVLEAEQASQKDEFPGYWNGGRGGQAITSLRAALREIKEPK